MRGIIRGNKTPNYQNYTREKWAEDSELENLEKLVIIGHEIILKMKCCYMNR